MAIRDRYNPDYSRLYPGVQPEIVAVLKQSDRKMKYMEVELKQESFVFEHDVRNARFIPSREDSLERMQEEDKAVFVSPGPGPEDEVIHMEELEQLREALKCLSSSERDLLDALFVEELSEQEYAIRIGISQRGVSKRWHKIRKKLKKLLNF